MNANDEIDALFNSAGRESEAIEALDGAMKQLKAARGVKARLATFDAPQLKEGLMRRKGALGGGPS
ncbi:hypothetical protein [Aeromicrobium ginsengisoli]|uniref:Uncharacterized protein n=1 Tax=Aeromicrobium ginsengisoli TaxID=363867 RepID=A0A5M4FEY1_9ACTN|nr:hypothetical protein [Aeromicrobium ginsengisoli]KAA1397769.1 hypothetical protein ESP70_010505 [Aeromicrobium ginsengisoli]